MKINEDFLNAYKSTLNPAPNDKKVTILESGLEFAKMLENEQAKSSDAKSIAQTAASKESKIAALRAQKDQYFYPSAVVEKAGKSDQMPHKLSAKLFDVHAQAKAASVLLEAMSQDSKSRMRKAANMLSPQGLEPHISDELIHNHALAFAKVLPQDKAALLERFNAANSDKLAKKSRFSEQELVKLKEQTDAFEAFFIKSMLDIAMPRQENPLFGKDAGDEIYRDMHHDAISRSLAGGMGLSEILFDYLKDS